jgi:HPt (histidine-containing phosphotransfer) domain-containing protein
MEAIGNEIITSFLSSAPKMLTQLHAAILSQNLKDVERSAHTLKGACSHFGAPELVNLCAELELKARQGDPWASLPDNSQIVETLLNRLLTEISQNRAMQGAS